MGYVLLEKEALACFLQTIASIKNAAIYYFNSIVFSLQQF